MILCKPIFVCKHGLIICKTYLQLPRHPGSSLDYCNSLYYNLPYSQLNRLQQIQNCLARAVVKAPKFTHTTLILRSLQWLKINQHMEYKILSITYKVLTTDAQPGYLQNLMSLESACIETRSSSFVTLSRPSSSSSFKITDRSFRFASPCLWNKLPASFHQPNPDRLPHSINLILIVLFLSLLNPIVWANLSHHHHCHCPKGIEWGRWG